MAKHEPELVRDVILKMLPTDNGSVHGDLVDAALATPAEEAAKLVDRALKWAKAPFCYSLPEKLGELVKHLAKGGKNREAVELARELLRLSLEPEEATHRIEEEFKLIAPSPQITCWFDHFTYEKIAVGCAPDLVRGAELKGFSFLCDMLETAIMLSSRSPDEVKPEDFSHIWRPSIEGQPPYHTHGFRDIFVTLVRDAAVQLVKQGSCTVADVVELLEERQWYVFRRIALRTLRVFRDPEDDQIVGLIEPRLVDKNLFDSRSVRSDYNLLLVEHCDRLQKQHLDTILSWIEQGPDVQGWQGSKDDIARYVRRWQRDRLRPLAEILPPVWAERYRNLQAEFGEQEVEECVVWMGGVSPRSPAELKAMRPDEIIDLLVPWEPEVDPLRPWLLSFESLEKNLSQAVTEKPDLFRDHYDQVRNLGARYVRAILSGLVKASKESVPFEWRPVVRLCEWVIAQPRQVHDRAAPIWQSDPEWGWTRSVLADLIEEGLKAEVAQIPFEHRERIWALIEALGDDPDPAVEREAGLREGNEIDALFYAKQSIRAQAVLGAFRYALWVKRHVQDAGLGKEAATSGLKIMPEVQELLEERLDDSTLTASAAPASHALTLGYECR